MKEFLKRYRQYLIPVLLFAVTAYLFTPQVLQNKVVNQSDIAAWRGMANEIIEYNKANPDEDPALWTNSMFSGMPATTISVIYDGDYTDYFYKLINKISGTRPPAYLLISLAGAFLMFLAFGINPWLSAIGAFAVTFCSYNLQIIQVGHNSKMVAIAFMPWVVAAVVYAYNKKALLGSVLFAFALSFQIKANHPQITYYLAMIILALAIAQLYSAIKEGYFKKFISVSAMLLVAGLLGIASNVNHLWPTYEYSKFTMRGGSELAQEEGKDQKGLDISYATNWSYSPEEMPNILIPNFNGGSSGGELSRKSHTYQALKSGGYSGAEQVIKQLPLYWGPQPFTAGPMYMGALSLFLFVLGLILIKGPLRWWVAGVSMLAVMLSWGSNLLLVTEFFFKYIPLYSKFRTVSMVLVILQITIPLLAIIVLDRILKKEYDQKRLKKAFAISLAITAGLSLVFAIIPSLAGSFVSAADARLPQALHEPLINDRMSLLRADAFRSIMFILAGAAVIWFGYKGKIKQGLVFGIIALIFVADLWMVGKRYLNDDHFVKRRDFENQYALRTVDKLILQDKDPNYRVLDLSIESPFNDSHISYHHKTIGGYSPAKLQRYQDMIDNHLYREMQQIATDLKESRTIDEAQSSLGNYPVLNMLNTRYIVISAESPPLINTNAMGNAWFVTDVKVVETNTREIKMLNPAEADQEFDIRSHAVVNNSYASLIEGYSKDTLASDEIIVLTAYSPNKLTYQYNSNSSRVALFSEIYYPAGWRAFVDGEELPIFRANYTLRGLKLPAGSHTVEFEFKPESFTKGELYSRIASGILILLLIGVVVKEILRKRVPTKQ